MTDVNITTTERGFQQGEEVICTYGSRVKVKESSAAMAPHIWIFMKTPSDLNEYAIKRDKYNGTWEEAAAHLTLEQAEKIRDQLDYLIKNHYHNS